MTICGQSNKPFDIPDDKKELLSRRSGLLTREGVNQQLVEYIKENWKQIADNIELLPPTKGDFAGENPAFNSTVITFAIACEYLEPLEYVDFLDKILNLYENDRISFVALEHILMARDAKDSFLSVNWAHPRVAMILQKAIELTPSEEKDYLSLWQEMAAGKLADNYMTNKSDDAPPPETLPGVKLERPWGSLIRKYERITGKKVEDGWEAESARSARRSLAGHEAASPEEITPASGRKLGLWLFAAFAVALLGWKFLRKRIE